MAELSELLARFGLDRAGSADPLSGGHINRTFKVTSGGRSYALQSLNPEVFTDPEAVARNISAAERCFASAEPENVRIPKFLRSSGELLTEFGGELWRAYEYISAGEVSGNVYHSTGRAFGAFMRVVNSGGVNFSTAIGGFHDFEHYLSRLRSVSGSELDFGATLLRLEQLGSRLKSVFTPELPRRNIHGDAKVANIIPGRPFTVIDLDTMMNCYAAVDYGDMVRSVVTSGGFDIDNIRELTSGFAEGLDGLLTEAEVSSLYCGVLWVTGELAVRYLTDYFSGERYFRSKTPEQCLERSRELMAQFEHFSAHSKELNTMIIKQFSK